MGCLKGAGSTLPWPISPDWPRSLRRGIAAKDIRGAPIGAASGGDDAGASREPFTKAHTRAAEPATLGRDCLGKAHFETVELIAPEDLTG
jgi:hypothetical protein